MRYKYQGIKKESSRDKAMKEGTPLAPTPLRLHPPCPGTAPSSDDNDDDDKAVAAGGAAYPAMPPPLPGSPLEGAAPPVPRPSSVMVPSSRSTPARTNVIAARGPGRAGPGGGAAGGGGVLVAYEGVAYEGLGLEGL